jgi:hypothetical protein
VLSATAAIVAEISLREKPDAGWRAWRNAAIDITGICLGTSLGSFRQTEPLIVFLKYLSLIGF